MPIRPPAHLLSPILMERDRLVAALRATIDHTFAAAESGCVGAAGEVDKLVYFFLEGLPLIENQFNRILGPQGVRATLSGIFCHQTPKVTPYPMFPFRDKTCELGDILFLVTYGKRLRGGFLGNAMLVQAKEDATDLDETLQAHLYEAATEFTYAKPTSLKDEVRVLGECYNALWYWGFKCLPRWRSTVKRPTEGLLARSHTARRHGVPFEYALADLICGVAGRRARALDATATDTGWSKIVDDLIRHTARAAFRRQNAYISRDREPLRGEDAVQAVNATVGSNAPFLVRSSFGRILGIFDEELAVLGLKLEAEGKAFDEESFKRQQSRRFAHRDAVAGTPPPPLGNERPGDDDDDGGGCSFVIVDFSSVQ